MIEEVSLLTHANAALNRDNLYSGTGIEYGFNKADKHIIKK